MYSELIETDSFSSLFSLPRGREKEGGDNIFLNFFHLNLSGTIWFDILPRFSANGQETGAENNVMREGAPTWVSNHTDLF